MTFNGLDLLAVLAVIVVGYLIGEYVGCKHNDRDRRTERLIHRNLMRQTCVGR